MSNPDTDHVPPILAALNEARLAAVLATEDDAEQVRVLAAYHFAFDFACDCELRGRSWSDVSEFLLRCPAHLRDAVGSALAPVIDTCVRPAADPEHGA